MIPGLFASLLLMLAAPAGITIVPPDDSGPVSLVVVEMGRGRYVDSLVARPDAPVGSGDLHGANILRHRARIVSLVAGVPLPPDVEIRKIWPHSISSVRNAERRLVFLERTDEGELLDVWDVPVAGGRACLAPEVIAFFQVAAPGRTPDDRGEICFNL